MYNIIITLFVQGTNIICLYCVEILLDAVAVIIYDNNHLKRKWLSTENVFRMALADGQRNFRSHYYEKVNLNW